MQIKCNFTNRHEKSEFDLILAEGGGGVYTLSVVGCPSGVYSSTLKTIIWP